MNYFDVGNMVYIVEGYGDVGSYYCLYSIYLNSCN